MKYLGLSVLIFFIPLSILYASYDYIAVTKATTKQQLSSINKKLKRLGLNMRYKKSKDNYIVYTGPYEKRYTRRVLQRMSRYFPYARVSNSKVKRKTMNSRQNILLSSQRNYRTTTKDTLYSGNFSLLLGVGFGVAESTHAIESGTVKPNMPKVNGINYSFGGGYSFESGFTPTLNYMRFDTGDIVFENIYAGLDYEFLSGKKFTPYFGILAGYSNLFWNTAPIETASPSSNSNSSSFLAGSQVGILYKDTNSVSYFVNYQCMFMQHTTNINDSTQTVTNLSKLQHNTLHSLKAGIQYKF